jgi:outer membrane receptor for ferrienterochelin and colicins
LLFDKIVSIEKEVPMNRRWPLGLIIALVAAAAFISAAPASQMELSQADYELQPIVVTATRLPQVLWDSDANVAVLTGMDIQQSFAQHLGEVLRLIPGVAVGEYGGLGQNVSLSLRGSTAGQVLVLIDGIPVNDFQLGGVDLNIIPLENVERVEVVRGAASALYGADAMGGVVNIITRQTTNNTPLSDLSYRQGENGLEKVTGRLARRLGSRWGVNVVGSSTEYDGFRENGDFGGRHFDARLDYAIGERGELAYSTQFYDADLGVPGMEDFPTLKARQEDRSWNQALSLKMHPGSGHEVKGMLYHQEHRQEFENPDWFIDATHRRWFSGLEAQHTFSHWSRHRVTWGGDLQRRRLDSSENGRHRLDRAALFAQDEVSLGPSWRVRLTARYDHHQGFDNQFNPDVTLTWLMNSRTSLFASLRRSYRAPTFNDLFWPQAQYDYDLDGKPDYRESGNKNIRPERAVSAQIGARVQRGIFSGDVCLFRRRVKDLIQWDNVDPDYLYGFWRPVNTSRATIQGVEARLSTSPGRPLRAAVVYSYLNGKDDTTDRRLPYQAEHQVMGYIQYGIELIAEQLELIARVGAEHTGRRYEDSIEARSLSANTLLHGKLTANFFRQLQVYVQGKNLLDKEYSLRSGYPLPGRTLTGGLSWTFWD